MPAGDGVAATSAERAEPWLAAAISASEGVRGGHAQTVLARLLPAAYPRSLPPPRTVDVEVAEGTKLRVEVTLNRHDSPMLVLVHGLAGSSRSGYMVRTAAEAFRRGYSVTRVNVRNAAGTHHLCRGLFNILQWPDVGAVLERLHAEYPGRRMIAAGFSLGGNSLLNLVGRERRYAELLAGVVAVNAPIDICRSVAQVCRPENRFYMRAFTWKMVRDIQIKRRLGEPYPEPVWRDLPTVPDIDLKFVLPETPFRTLKDYYTEASASPYIRNIEIPVEIISALDDPIIPPQMIADVPSYAASVSVRLVGNGGHIGYLHRTGLELRFWAGGAIADFCERVAPIDECNGRRANGIALSA